MTTDRGSEHRTPPRAASGMVEFGRDDRLMVIAPHPDDESLATAGLLQAALAAGARARVVYMTNGQNNPWAQLVAEGRWPRSPADRERWGARRRGEAVEALAVLGVEPEETAFLGLPDQGLTDLLMGGSPAPIALMATELFAWRPTVIALPALTDQHPDHSAAAVLARFARRRSGVRPRLELAYQVHGSLALERDLGWVPLGERERAKKRTAVLRHVSQLWWRRRAFLESVGDEERFHLTNGPPTPDQRHPVRSARIEGDEIEVELAPVRAMAFGNPVLRVLLDRADGLIARSVALPGWRRAGVRRLARGRGPLHIRLKGRGRSRAADTPPLDCFVKLDWPFERRLGLFDSWGWRGVPLPDLVSQESEPPVHQDQVAALPGAGHFFENVRM